jgi:hypothetical protein
VFFNVRFPRLFGKVSRMISVTPGGMCVVRGLFVRAAFVVLGRFSVMASGFRVMLGRLLVVLGCFLRHGDDSCWPIGSPTSRVGTTYRR